MNLFIMGAPNTATSTLVGILNCHPEIFILYECYLNRSKPSKYGQKFLRSYPDARYLFRQDDLNASYNRFREYLNYRIVGDKFVGLDIDLKLLKDSKVIFMVRDVRTWLPKVKDIYHLGYDVVPTAIDYAIYLSKSLQLPDKIHIHMEDLFHNNVNMLVRISNFLGLNGYLHLKNWWDKIEKMDDKAKNCLNWWRSHYSSTIKPKEQDTKVKLKEHPFWDEYLPIFDKYHYGIKTEEDIAKLKSLIKYSPLTLDDLYESYESIIIQKKSPRKKIKSMVNVIYNIIMKYL